MADQKPTEWVTGLLIAVNIAAFVVEIIAGVAVWSPNNDDLLAVGGNLGAKTLGDHEWWRLVSAMFLHGGVLHLVGNIVILWALHTAEDLYGHAAYAVIYFTAGLIGGIVSLAREGWLVTVGASGAVFGVWGAYAAFLVVRRKQVDAKDWRNNAQRLGVVMVVSLVTTIGAPGVDFAAHVGGLVAGFAAGWMLLAFRQRLATLGGGLALVIIGLLVLPVPFDIDAPRGEFHRVADYCEKTYKHALATNDPHALADLVEHDLLPKWHAARAGIDAVRDQDIPDDIKPVFAALRTYAKDREDGWRELVRLEHEHLPLDSNQQADARADADFKRLQLEYAKVRPPK